MYHSFVFWNKTTYRQIKSEHVFDPENLLLAFNKIGCRLYMFHVYSHFSRKHFLLVFHVFNIVSVFILLKSIQRKTIIKFNIIFNGSVQILFKEKKLWRVLCNKYCWGHLSLLYIQMVILYTNNIPRNLSIFAKLKLILLFILFEYYN